MGATGATSARVAFGSLVVVIKNHPRVGHVGTVAGVLAFAM